MSAPAKIYLQQEVVRYKLCNKEWLDKPIINQGYQLIEYIRSDVATDWTKPCQCTESERTGETWCCNHCGKPVNPASDQSAEIDLLRNGNNELNQEIEKMSAEIERLKGLIENALQDRNKSNIQILKLTEENERLKKMRNELADVLKRCSASLATYGSHPIIEKAVSVALSKVTH